MSSSDNNKPNDVPEFLHLHYSTTDGRPANMIPIEDIQKKALPLVLFGHVFEEFEVLSAKITPEEINKYNEELESYNKELQYNDSMGMKTDREAPKEPGDLESATYTRMNINMSDKIFTNWIEDWDEKNQCPIIVIETYPRIGGRVDQITLKTTRSEWVNLLTKLGAVCH